MRNSAFQRLFLRRERQIKALAASRALHQNRGEGDFVYNTRAKLADLPETTRLESRSAGASGGAQSATSASARGVSSALFRLDLATHRLYKPPTYRQAVSTARVRTEHPA